MEQITGVIKQVIYTSDNNYAILSVKPKKGKTFTAVGEVREPSKNAEIILYGNFAMSRGERQFKIKESVCLVDKEKTTAKAFLMILNGVGETKAENITDLLGNNIPAIFEHPTRLLEVKGFSEKNLMKTVASYHDNKMLYPIYQIVQGDITYFQAKQIHEKYGDKAVTVLKKNPYMLIKAINNFGFLKVDKIAQNSGIRENSDDRVEAAIVHVMTEEANTNGHCFLYESRIKERCVDLLLPLYKIKNAFYEDVLKTKVPTNRLAFLETELGKLLDQHEKIFLNMLESWEDPVSQEKYCKKYGLSTEEQEAVTIFLNKKSAFMKQISTILNDRAVDMSGLSIDKIIKKTKTNAFETAGFVKESDNFGNPRFFSTLNYKREVDIAVKIIEIKNREDDVLQITEDDITARIKAYEKEEGYSLGEEQVLAVRTSVTNRISVITGGPGRGKTTIIKLIADLWMAQRAERDFYNVVMLAPTGRAAQRMSESTGYSASTIHRFLLSTKNKEASNDDDKLTLYIVDECSMEDLHLAYRLLSTVKNARIIFVGDINQLPCIGVGKFFEDLINCGVVPCTKLITCYRSSGSISANADIINEGGRPQDLIQDHMTKIGYFEDDDTLQSAILTLYKKSLETYKPEDICILVPMVERGKTSVKALNKLIQKECNPLQPGAEEYKYKDTIFRVGDRVIYTKNNYSVECVKMNKFTKKMGSVHGIFNGETGTVKKIVNDSVLVVFDDGKESFLKSTDLLLLNLAYAMTIHKSQGCEYKCTIVALSKSNYILLKKKLFYTGESRAKQLLYILGNKTAIWKAMTTNDDDIRNTTLADKIKSLDEFYKQKNEKRRNVAC